jgi:hypothetical protein
MMAARRGKAVWAKRVYSGQQPAKKRSVCPAKRVFRTVTGEKRVKLSCKEHNQDSNWRKRGQAVQKKQK